MSGAIASPQTSSRRRPGSVQASIRTLIFCSGSMPNFASIACWADPGLRRDDALTDRSVSAVLKWTELLLTEAAQ